MFGLADQALELGVEQVHFFALVFCGFTSYCILGGVLQGAGDVMVQTYATITALIIRVALGYIGVGRRLLRLQRRLGHKPHRLDCRYRHHLPHVISAVNGRQKRSPAGTRRGETEPLKICAEPGE